MGRKKIERDFDKIKIIRCTCGKCQNCIRRERYQNDLKYRERKKQEVARYNQAKKVHTKYINSLSADELLNLVQKNEY